MPIILPYRIAWICLLSLGLAQCSHPQTDKEVPAPKASPDPEQKLLRLLPDETIATMALRPHILDSSGLLQAGNSELNQVLSILGMLFPKHFENIQSFVSPNPETQQTPLQEKFNEVFAGGISKKATWLAGWALFEADAIMHQLDFGIVPPNQGESYFTHLRIVVPVEEPTMARATLERLFKPLEAYEVHIGIAIHDAIARVDCLLPTGAKLAQGNTTLAKLQSLFLNPRPLDSASTSPARALLHDPSLPVAAFLDVRQLMNFSSLSALGDMHEALKQAPPAAHVALLAAASRVVLLSRMIYEDDRTAFHEYGVAFQYDASKRRTTRLVLGLSPQGRATLGPQAPIRIPAFAQTNADIQIDIQTKDVWNIQPKLPRKIAELLEEAGPEATPFQALGEIFINAGAFAYWTMISNTFGVTEALWPFIKTEVPAAIQEFVKADLVSFQLNLPKNQKQPITGAGFIQAALEQQEDIEKHLQSLQTLLQIQGSKLNYDYAVSEQSIMIRIALNQRFEDAFKGDGATREIPSGFKTKLTHLNRMPSGLDFSQLGLGAKDYTHTAAYLRGDHILLIDSDHPIQDMPSHPIPAFQPDQAGDSPAIGCRYEILSLMEKLFEGLALSPSSDKAELQTIRDPWQKSAACAETTGQQAPDISKLDAMIQVLKK